LDLYQYNITATPVTAVSSATSTAPVTASSTISCPGSDGTTYTAVIGETFLLECFIDHYGNDLTMEYTDDYASCVETCSDTAKCIALSWVPPGPAPCYMKSAIGTGIQNQEVWGARKAGTSSGTSTTASASPAPTFSLLGCYMDSVSARSLSVRMGVLGGAGNMTQENCIAACSVAGYTLAGVEV
jgi:hypothetical protein